MSLSSDGSQPLITQSKHIVESRKPLLQRLARLLCPCLRRPNPSEPQHITTSTDESKDSQSLNKSAVLVEPTTDSSNNSPIKQIEQPKKPMPTYKSALERKKVHTQEEIFERRKSHDFRRNCPVLHHPQQTLFLAGGTSKMLVYVTTAKILPSAHVMDRTRNLIESKQSNRSLFRNCKLDHFWHRRYLLFERFDHGVQLDEDSWFSALPEAVAQYLSQRVACNTVLVGYCGVGCQALRFASHSQKVLAVDDNSTKLQHLQTNATIYGVDNLQILNHDFMELPQLKADVVYLSLSRYISFQNSGQLIDLQQDLKPTLSQLLRKALSIAKNIVVLAPPNTSEQQLSDIFSRALKEFLPKNSSCCIQMEKLYFINKLKYVVVYYGPQVNRKIALSDELAFMYAMAEAASQEPLSQVRRVIKELRERLGMVMVLHCLVDCQRFYANVRVTERLCEYIRDRRLLPMAVIDSILKKTKTQPLVEDTFEQQKFDLEVSQRTVSSVTDDLQSYRSGSLTNNLRLTLGRYSQDRRD